MIWILGAALGISIGINIQLYLENRELQKGFAEVETLVNRIEEKLKKSVENLAETVDN